MKKLTELNILVLDDAPKSVLMNMTNHLSQDVGARACQNEPTTHDNGGYYIPFMMPWRFGESIMVTVTCLGQNKQQLLPCLRDVEFLQKFEIICVDMIWDNLNPGFSDDDFGLLKNDYQSSNNAGIVIAKFVRAYAQHDPIMAIISSLTPTVPMIHRAIQAGAYQFLRKQDAIGLCNLLVFAADRIDRRIIAEAKTVIAEMVIAERKDLLISPRELLEYLPWRPSQTEYIVSRSLLEASPNNVSVTDIISLMGLAYSEDPPFERCIQTIQAELKRFHYNIKHENDQMRVVSTKA